MRSCENGWGFLYQSHHEGIMTTKQLLTILCMALLLTSCNDKVGCFAWTEAEGTCPPQEEALEYFGSCNTEVESVDSEAEYDGQYCCYEITKYPVDSPPRACAFGALSD